MNSNAVVQSDTFYTTQSHEMCEVVIRLVLLLDQTQKNLISALYCAKTKRVKDFAPVFCYTRTNLLKDFVSEN